MGGMAGFGHIGSHSVDGGSNGICLSLKARCARGFKCSAPTDTCTEPNLGAHATGRPSILIISTTDRNEMSCTDSWHRHAPAGTSRRGMYRPITHPQLCHNLGWPRSAPQTRARGVSETPDRRLEDSRVFEDIRPSRRSHLGCTVFGPPEFGAADTTAPLSAGRGHDRC
jgi:hypothetical protein